VHVYVVHDQFDVTYTYKFWHYGISFGTDEDNIFVLYLQIAMWCADERSITVTLETAMS